MCIFTLIQDSTNQLITNPLLDSFHPQLTRIPPMSTNLEVRRFGTGSYTLLHDADPEFSLAALDATLCLLPPGMLMA